jgi:hypothetical protein
MAQNKNIRIGPVALSATLTTNILNPAAAGAGVGYTPTASYIILRHIRIVNKTATPATFSFWVGATGANAAGTEFMGIAKSVPANDAIDWTGALVLNATDFLVGGAGTPAALTFQAEGEVGLA